MLGKLTKGDLLRLLLVRAFGWLLGAAASLIAVSLVLLAIYLVFFNYPEHLEGWVEAEAEKMLGRPVQIESIYVDLPKLAFVIRGVAVEADDEGPPLLEIESLRARLRPTGFARLRLHLARLQLSGLIIRIEDHGEGRVELPARRRPELRSQPGAGFAFMADQIQVEEAAFVYNNQNIPWRLDASRVTAALDRKAANRYRGRVTYQRGVLRIKNHRPFESSLSARVALTGRDLHVEELSAEGDFFQGWAEGRVRLGSDPLVHLSLRVTSQVGPAALSLLGSRWLDAPEGRPATFQGTLAMGRGWHLLRGVAEMPEGRVAGLPVRGWKSAVLWDRSVFELQSAEGQVASGTSHLDFRQPLPVEGKTAQLRVRFEDIVLESLVEAMVGEPGPLASSVSGEAQLVLSRGDLSRLSGRVDLEARSAERPARVGLNLLATAILTDGTLTIESARFKTDTVTGRLSGVYPRTGAAALEVEIDAQDLAEADRLQQRIRTLFRRGNPARLIGVSGRGRARGRLVGRLPRMTFEGGFEGRDVGFRRVQWGSVEAAGSLSADILKFTRFVARNKDGALRGEGSFSLDGEATPADFHLAVRATHWPAPDVGRFFSIPLELRGRLSAEGELARQNNHLAGSVSGLVREGALQSVAFDLAEARARLRGQSIRFDPMSIHRGRAQLEGWMKINLQTRAIQGELQAQRFPLHSLGGRSPWTLAGEADGSIRLSGTLGQPELVLQASSQAVTLAGMPAGRARVAAELHGETLTTALTLRGEGIELEAHARTELSPQYPIDGRIRWEKTDLGPLIRALKPGLPESLRWTSSGEMTLAGRLAAPESLSARAHLKQARLEIANYRLRAAAPVTARLRGGVLHLDQVVLDGEASRLRVRGRLGLLQDATLDVEAEGSVELGLLESVYPTVAASGLVDLKARVEGRLERPSLSGHADFRGGALRLHGFPQALADLRGRLVFDNRTVRFSDLEARFGGAPVSISGSASLSGFRPDSFEVRARADGVRLRYPEGLIAILDAELSLAGTSGSSVLSGRVEVQDAVWSREYDLTTTMLGTRDTFDRLEDADVPLANIGLDIEIVTPGGVRVRNSRASVDARAELQLRGTLRRPALLGHAESQRGEVFFLGQRYNIVTGKVDFVDPTSIKPFFDLAAETRVRNYRVELRLS
ncbi:MAG: translocation/assembly module TamB domain-containing protein, partial [Acidobacteriota bacterium]